LKPPSNGVDVVRGNPKALADLDRRQPVVVVGRRGILLVLQKLRIRLFRLRRAGKNNREAMHREVGGN
jgi:hypothetical protein